MRYKVPQFIEVEDKIVGPLTIKQFVYLAGGGGMCYVLYKALPLVLAAPLILALGGFALALTFYRVNGRPFIQVVQSYLSFAAGGKLYVWKKSNKKTTQTQKTLQVPTPAAGLPRMNDSRLKDLSWSLDVLDISKGSQ
ncbi:PrgI family protein [Candidatus Nomurabacteria bacterium]|nr:PrgI family protein [Candidatus Nomurabacteria bacterium]MCB9820440.1 PrgI family protein [Candidatus Nomurabacteria bacterium]